MWYAVTFVGCWAVAADINHAWMKAAATKTVKKTGFNHVCCIIDWQLEPIYKVRKQSRKSDRITASNRRKKGTDAFFG
jgi:hypothetical protein